MARVCDRGGRVGGPVPQGDGPARAHRVPHRGRSSPDVREILRETMFAPTVTGSPLESACRVISRLRAAAAAATTAASSRSSAATAGRRDPGLRDPHPHRRHRRAPAGCASASAPRWSAHSDPASEVAETRAKAAGLLAALRRRRRAGPRSAAHPEVRRGAGPAQRHARRLLARRRPTPRTAPAPSWPAAGCWSSTPRTPSPRCSATSCARWA